MQGKARLGTVVNKKNAAAVALTAVKNEDQRELAKLVESAKQLFNEGPRVSWGGGIMGPKSQVRPPISLPSFPGFLPALQLVKCEGGNAKGEISAGEISSGR